MWIGFDDTDSRSGGCTTYLATEIIKKIRYDIIGLPRLVRLNPNIPWKTRGNGAIAMKVAIGGGRKTRIGHINGRKIFSYETIKEDACIEHIFPLLDDIIKTHSQKESEPAYVITARKLPSSLYIKAVREVLEKDEIIQSLDSSVHYKMFNGGRGIIGAAAAISWRPCDRTYEIITYGEEKKLDRNSVILMDKTCLSTFNNYDYKNDYIAILPKSPSPVFYGIRGDSKEELFKAHQMIIGSPEERWLLFETNQGTDDHLRRTLIEKVAPNSSVIVRGVVTQKPFDIAGGHVIFTISNKQSIDCAAYEPTKEFRKVVRQLAIGDEVVVYGSVREQPFTINIEKLKVLKITDVYKKRENPVCQYCQKHMKSIGRKKGYRCVKCGTKTRVETAIYEKMDRQLTRGFYEVPVIARRHLAKPLKRINN